MTNRIYGIIIAVVVILVIAWNATFVVNEREQAAVLRFGDIQRTISEPGLYFKWPLGFAGADTVRKLPDRLLRFDLDDIRVQVSGGRFYEVDAFLVYNISNVAQFLQAVSGSIPAAEQRLRTRLDAALRRVYGLRGFQAALSDERADMMRQVRDQIRPDAESLGIELDDVRIRRTDLTQDVSQQTYERMQAERLAEAERLRARGQVAARRIRAAADREVVETVAAAQRDAEILQGEGDAQRTRIFADAFGSNPEFFDFYRSMQAYRSALENSGTTMVLSPDSEFFKYFQNQLGRGGQSAQGGARASSAGGGGNGDGSGASGASGDNGSAGSSGGNGSAGSSGGNGGTGSSGGLQPSEGLSLTPQADDDLSIDEESGGQAQSGASAGGDGASGSGESGTDAGGGGGSDEAGAASSGEGTASPSGGDAAPTNGSGPNGQ